MHTDPVMFWQSVIIVTALVVSTVHYWVKKK